MKLADKNFKIFSNFDAFFLYDIWRNMDSKYLFYRYHMCQYFGDLHWYDSGHGTPCKKILDNTSICRLYLHLHQMPHNILLNFWNPLQSIGSPLLLLLVNPHFVLLFLVLLKSHWKLHFEQMAISFQQHSAAFLGQV